MSSSTSTCGGNASSGSGALSLMGCVREASPPPQDHHLGMGEFSVQKSTDTLPKEPKKRRFHPLRGLRKIFRRKSRGAADARINSRNNERDGELPSRDREEVTLRHPAGTAEEARSRSASELLTDSCGHPSKQRIVWSKKYRISLRKSFNHVFLRRSGIEESFAKLRGGSGQLSVSHDSVFPGEVPQTRPLSSLDTLATLERRQTKASDETVHKDYASHVPYNHRISLRVLEQIKTAIENRNQLASSTSPDSTHAPHANSQHYQQETTENRFTRPEKRDRIEEEPPQFRVTRTQQDVVERVTPSQKEDLPKLEIASLNHTAAHHRISVRPKNRRPPRRTVATISTMSCSTIATTISESSDAPDSLEPMTSSTGSSPIDPKTPSILRKPSSRLSHNSDIFEELETKLPRKQGTSVASLSPDSLDSTGARTILDNQETDDNREMKPVSRKPSNRISKGSEIFDELESRLPKRRSSSSRNSKSPDSLDNSFSKSTDGFDKLMGNEDIKTTVRRNLNMISKSTEGFDKITETHEVRPTPRRLTNPISKSTDAFDKLIEHDEPRPVSRRLLLPISKSSDIVTKSSNSCELLDSITSADSMIERRRSSFEIRPRRGMKAMSMSSENFEALEQVQELQKRNSASDVNSSRGKRHCKIISKSSESFEPMETSSMQEESNRSSMDLIKSSWRSSKRVSSETTDNLDEEKNERKIRRPPKRVPSSSIIDIFRKEASHAEEEKRPVPMRKPSRIQKSSESSELGSTDTLDSERRNKSSDSTETLDSLEKDSEHEVRDEEMADSILDKQDSWMKSDSDSAKADSPEEPKTPEKNYWRQTSESKENIDIHQLLAITIVSRMSDNGNNQRNSSVQFPKKKLTSPPTSPTVKQEDNKLLFNNLLASKNDEDLQNMLNGNISEVSTDTKSFKEKLIMFEKLGK